MSKAIKFIKENKILVFALTVVLLSFVFLAIPGFAHFVPSNFVGKKTFKYNLSGYQLFFNTVETYAGSDVKIAESAVGAGIAIFAMLILAVPGIIFSKKSSFVSLLTSLLLIVVAVLFFTISVTASKVYNNPFFVAGDEPVKYYCYLWVPYFLGGWITIAGGLLMYKTVIDMKNEIKRPAQPKGPTYSYLHK